MPIYEYRCKQCTAIFETLQESSDKPPPCPRCGTRHVERQLSRTSFKFNGDGWARDGYSKPRPTRGNP